MPALPKALLVLGALAAALAVGLGAFGAHALRERLSADSLALWHTAVQYHFWHALGILVVAVLSFHQPQNGWLAGAALALAAGILLFSGSLYALALGAPRAMGAITPVGGIALLLGWAALACAALRG
jgi:uncharacterized membrane protein YgdD (TMEM256/DUF423 family)